MYNELIPKEQHYDTTNASLFDNVTGTPYMFFYDAHVQGFPIWLDSNLNQERAVEWVSMLEEGFFISAETVKLIVMVPIFNPLENTFALTTITFTWGTYGGIGVSESTTIVNLWLEDDGKKKNPFFLELEEFT